MNGEDKLKTERAALQGILDAFGGDRARWPAGAEARFAALIASDAAAGAAVAEAAALDAVLAEAPRVPAARASALLDRIMAEVAKPASLAAPARRDAVVIPLKPRTTLPAPAPSPAVRPVPARRARWQAGALLAASLLMGVVGGASGQFGTSLDDLGALAGLIGDGDTLTAALGQPVEVPGEEDTL